MFFVQVADKAGSVAPPNSTPASTKPPVKSTTNPTKPPTERDPKPFTPTSSQLPKNDSKSVRSCESVLFPCPSLYRLSSPSGSHDGCSSAASTETFSGGFSSRRIASPQGSNTPNECPPAIETTLAPTWAPAEGPGVQLQSITTSSCRELERQSENRGDPSPNGNSMLCGDWRRYPRKLRASDDERDSPESFYIWNFPFSGE